MNKIYLNIIFFAIFLTFNILKAQNSNASLKISFDQKISESGFQSDDLKDANWMIKDRNTNQTIIDGHGDSLYEYVFNEPGLFSIEFILNHSHSEHDGDCFHPDLPNKLDIEVSDVSIIYDIENVNLSKNIEGGVDVSGTQLSIPILVKSYFGNEVEIPLRIIAQGVDVSIEGNLQEEQQVLSHGNYILTYNLSGTATKNTYISFDFEDVNKNVSSYYHIEMVK